MNAPTESPSLHDVIEDLGLDDTQKRELHRAIDEHHMSVNESRSRDEQRRRQRPPLLDLLDQARPFAERMIYREGILPELADSGSDCVDGFLEVRGEWCNHVVPDAYHIIGNLDDGAKPFEAAYAISDASYVLGIAVGLQLRGGAR